MDPRLLEKSHATVQPPFVRAHNSLYCKQPPDRRPFFHSDRTYGRSGLRVTTQGPLPHMDPWLLEKSHDTRVQPAFVRAHSPHCKQNTLEYITEFCLHLDLVRRGTHSYLRLEGTSHLLPLVRSGSKSERYMCGNRHGVLASCPPCNRRCTSCTSPSG